MGLTENQDGYISSRGQGEEKTHGNEMKRQPAACN